MEINPVQAAQAVTQIQQNQFEYHPDAAQYKGASWADVIQVERGISRQEALEIANNNPDIDYFFWVKGDMMVLEFAPDQKFNPDEDPFNLVKRDDYIFDDGNPGLGYFRLFTHGDAVFFKNGDNKWLGSAPALADVYEKR